MNYNSLHATDDVNICELISDYFQPTYSNLPLVPHSIDSVASKSITSKQLESAFMKLNITSFSSPDGIPSASFMHCWSNFKEPVLLLFNKSLVSRIFPQAWKLPFCVRVHFFAKLPQDVGISLSLADLDQHRGYHVLILRELGLGLLRFLLLQGWCLPRRF